MNSQRFTELLNLYLDDEISPQDLGDLMAETRRCEDRQRLFVDYCRIHKACVLLGDPSDRKGRNRSLRQVVYALGGLAAAFALLGMAGRNLVPLFNDAGPQPVAIQNNAESGNTVFFPEMASAEVATPRFMRTGAPYQIDYVGLAARPVSSRDRLAEWNDRVILDRERSDFGLKLDGLFAEDLLEFGALPLQDDPFNAIDGATSAFGGDTLKAAFSPASSIGVVSSQDSRSNLK